MSLVHPHLRPTQAATLSTRVLYSALYAQYTSSRLHETLRSNDDAPDTIIYRRTVAYTPNTNTRKPAYSPIISCNLLRLASLLYYSLITTTVLIFPLGSSRLRLHRNPPIFPAACLRQPKTTTSQRACINLPTFRRLAYFAVHPRAWVQTRSICPAYTQLHSHNSS